MLQAAGRTRLIRASAVIAAVLATLMLTTSCGGSPQRHAAAPAKRATPARPAASAHVSTAPAASTAPATTAPPTTAPPAAAPTGKAGRYRVGERQLTFTEPDHTGPAGAHLAQRTLVTPVWYPLAQDSGSHPATGPFPLILFAPGFGQCSSYYGHLLQTWASAGYVVAAVDFPRTSCLAGQGAYEPDLVNQPEDMSYELGRLLALSAQPGDLFSGLLNPGEIAAAGQSDGGDTVAALAANTCCTDHRLKAVAVLSGAEWPPMPGRYFPGGAPPMMFVQGSADTVNPPWTSVQLYRSDHSHTRYYLALLGATHLEPYEGDNSVERLAARVTLAFFNRYVAGQAGSLAVMKRYGNISGISALGSGGHLPPGAG